jgi:hypothetical protein
MKPEPKFFETGNKKFRLCNTEEYRGCVAKVGIYGTCSVSDPDVSALYVHPGSG